MPKRVSASFYVASMKYGTSDFVEVVLAATTRNIGSADGYKSPNEDWSKYTPSGTITMNVSEQRSGAVAAFEEARRRKVDIGIIFEIPDPE